VLPFARLDVDFNDYAVVSWGGQSSALIERQSICNDFTATHTDDIYRCWVRLVILVSSRCRLISLLQLKSKPNIKCLGYTHEDLMRGPFKKGCHRKCSSFYSTRRCLWDWLEQTDVNAGVWQWLKWLLGAEPDTQHFAFVWLRPFKGPRTLQLLAINHRRLIPLVSIHFTLCEVGYFFLCAGGVAKCVNSLWFGWCRGDEHALLTTTCSLLNYPVYFGFIIFKKKSCLVFTDCFHYCPVFIFLTIYKSTFLLSLMLNDVYEQGPQRHDV